MIDDNQLSSRYGRDFPLINLEAWRGNRQAPGGGSLFPDHFEGYQHLWKYEIAAGAKIIWTSASDPIDRIEGTVESISHDLSTELAEIAWVDRLDKTIAAYSEISRTEIDAELNPAASSKSNAEEIAVLNDQLRYRLRPNSPGLSLSFGVMKLGMQQVAEIVKAICNYSYLGETDDPSPERNFGAFDFTFGPASDEETFRVSWKIDYYDNSLELGSPDPANPALTCRIITVSIEGEFD